jgi:hypothetical protein
MDMPTTILPPRARTEETGKKIRDKKMTQIRRMITTLSGKTDSQIAELDSATRIVVLPLRWQGMPQTAANDPRTESRNYLIESTGKARGFIKTVALTPTRAGVQALAVLHLLTHMFLPLNFFVSNLFVFISPSRACGWSPQLRQPLKFRKNPLA